jgi:hypothetical protein
VPHTLVKRRKVTPRFYYICRWHRARKGGCEHAKYYRAEEIEDRVGQFVLDLIRNPDTLREQVEAQAARDRAALCDQRKHIEALASRLAEVESERDRLVRLYTRGKLTDSEYDAYTGELAERKKTAEEELAKLEDEERYIEHLDALFSDVEGFLRELPDEIDYMPQIRRYVPERELNAKGVYVQPHTDDPEQEPAEPYYERTPEEMEQLRREAERERAERYRTTYERLNLKVVAYPNGDLEISWTGGVCKLSGTRW